MGDVTNMNDFIVNQQSIDNKGLLKTTGIGELSNKQLMQRTNETSGDCIDQIVSGEIYKSQPAEGFNDDLEEQVIAMLTNN